MSEVNKPNVALFDLDGCLFDDAWREHHRHSGNYVEYHKGIGRDPVIWHVKQHILKLTKEGTQVIFSTSRPVTYRHETMEALAKTFGGSILTNLIVEMRPRHDKLSSPDLKYVVAKKWMDLGHKIVSGYDDRRDVLAMYYDLGITPYVCDRMGIVCYGVRDLKPPAAPGEVEVDDPGQTPPNRERDAGDVLREALATFDSRKSQYGVAHVKNSEIMLILFPNGITLKTPEDHQMFHAVGHMVGKLVRFASTGLTHIDSAHDLAVYSAQAVTFADKHSIDIHKED